MNDETLGDIENLLENEKRDRESGRVTTRWEGIESKIDLGLSLVEDEAKTKALRLGLFTSAHEGYGIIAEELMELLDAIKSNDIERIKSEAVQVAAAGTILVATYVLGGGFQAEEVKEQKGGEGEGEIEVLGDLLSLCGIYVDSDTIRGWTPAEREAVSDYAGALHLNASDNDDVEMPETPECLASVLLKTKGERGGWKKK